MATRRTAAKSIKLDATARAPHLRRWTAAVVVLPHFVLAISLLGCGGGSEPEPIAAVYKYMGSVQCTGGGISLAAMQRQLVDGGVTVLGSACGLDGKAYITVCGAPDGAIGIFDVPASQTDRALSLSFARLSDLPAAVRVPCR